MEIGSCLTEDELFGVRALAAKEFHVVDLFGNEGIKVPVYHLGPRKGDIVKCDEEIYWEYATWLYSQYSGEETARLVFPSYKGYDVISVDRLPEGLETPNIVKFDSYIISPLSQKELLRLAEEYRNYLAKKANTNKEKSGEKDLKDPIAEFLNKKWMECNDMLLAYVAQFSVEGNRRNVYVHKREKETKIELCRNYCLFLRNLLRRL